MMNNAKSSGVSFTPCNTTVSSFSSGRQFRFLNVLNDPLWREGCSDSLQGRKHSINVSLSCFPLSNFNNPRDPTPSRRPARTSHRQLSWSGIALGERGVEGDNAEIPCEYSQLVRTRKTQRDNRLQNSHILTQRNVDHVLATRRSLKECIITFFVVPVEFYSCSFVLHIWKKNIIIIVESALEPVSISKRYINRDI